MEPEQRKFSIGYAIDELDALGKARGISPLVGGHDEREQTLNQLLAELDGFDTRKGVIILAATNRPEILDPALLRPGRFDRQVALDRPDLKGREKILRVHVRGVTLAPELDLSVVAAGTPGFVGADLANLVKEAALHAARTGKAAVDAADFDEAIDRVVGGTERKSRVINPKAKEIVAYHAESRPHVDRVAKISVIPRGIAALGYTQHGLATFEAPRQALFLNVPSMAQRECSEETARRIDAEIEQLLETAHALDELIRETVPGHA